MLVTGGAGFIGHRLIGKLSESGSAVTIVDNLSNANLTYEISSDGNLTASEEHHQSPATRSYTQEQAITLYREAGFNNIQAFHEFTFEPVKPEDETFCVLGFKPK